MKKFVAILSIALSSMTLRAADFGMSSDFIATYKDKVFAMQINYDVGYSFFGESLYVGVGPEIDGNFGNGYSSFGAGGYAKVRYIVPLNFSVQPYVLGRLGYSYNFSLDDGGLFYGFGAGVHFAKHWGIGVYCAISNVTSTEVHHKKYASKTEIKNHTYHTKTWTTESSETTFTPGLILTYRF